VRTFFVKKNKIEDRSDVWKNAEKNNTYPEQTSEYEDEETGEMVKSTVYVYGLLL